MELKPKRTAEVEKGGKCPVERVLVTSAIKSVLVPIDFLSRSMNALLHAASIASTLESKLTLLHVVEPEPASEFVKAFPLAKKEEQIVLAAKVKPKRTLGKLRVPSGLVGELVIFGHSTDGISAMAQRRKADIIIIFTHGFTGLKHVLLSSTTECMVRNASCPALVLKQS